MAFFEMMKEMIRVSNGVKVECQWDFPIREGASDLYSMMFMLPATLMKDIEGNGPAYPVQNSLRDLSKEFTESGRITFRFIPERGVDTSSLVDVYQFATDRFSSKFDQLVMIGFGDGADQFVKNYYEFYRVYRPTAAVLMGTTAKVIELNNLTCPYLLIHGMEDSIFSSYPQELFGEAVHHHQMRYGDATTHLVVPRLSKELGENALDPEVIHEIIYWCKTVPIRPSRQILNLNKLA
jgi:hypothetical protein